MHFNLQSIEFWHISTDMKAGNKNEIGRQINIIPFLYESIIHTQPSQIYAREIFKTGKMDSIHYTIILIHMMGRIQKKNKKKITNGKT